MKIEVQKTVTYLFTCLKMDDTIAMFYANRNDPIKKGNLVMFQRKDISEADQVVWYFHLLKSFPQFVVIHTVKGFGVVSKAEINVFLELSCFFDDPMDVGNLISGSSPFSKSSSNI